MHIKRISGAAIGLLFLLSCGSQQVKNVPTKVLISPVQAKQLNTDSIRALPTALSVVDSSKAVAIPMVLTAADRVRLLMQEGIDKTADWSEAMHYDVRKPNFVIIHHTAQNSTAQTVRTFQLEHTKVSAHYVIGRDGQIIQMLNDYLRSWHAGRSKWGAITDMNSMSIGIELDNNGREAFSDAQINALLALLTKLKSKYSIPFTNFLGHADIAPSRKDDPSALFPWKKLADQGFGVWYDESQLQTPPADFNAEDALRIIGYDVSKLQSTIIAFKRKFIPFDKSVTLSAYDKSVLYNLYKRYY